MDENTLRKVVEEIINNAVKPIIHRLEGIEGRLDDPDTGLGAINRRLDGNTGAVIELEKTVKGYADMYQINDSNIRKMEKRLETVEKDAGVDVPPELYLESFAKAA